MQHSQYYAEDIFGVSGTPNLFHYELRTKESLAQQLTESMTGLEQLLDNWQKRVAEEIDAEPVNRFAFPDIVKFLIVEYQEYLYTLQKTAKVLNPNMHPNYRNSNMTSKEKKGDSKSREKAEKAKQQR